MRVLFLTNLPAPYRIEFFNELGKFCDLTVLFERQSANDRNSAWFSNSIQNFKAVFLKGKKLGHDSAFCLGVLTYLKRGKFDLYVIGGYSTPTAMLASLWLKLGRIPYVLNVDGGFIKNDNRIKTALKKYFISSATWWLSSGRETNRYLEHYGVVIERTFIYPFTSVNSMDLYKEIASNMEKAYLRQELGITGDKVIVSVGRFIPSKGFDILIKAWKHIINDATLIIIGGGSEEEKLTSLLSETGLSNVYLIGFKDKEELRRYYRAADLFVLPTREDVWGLVINEAMACGLPITSTDKCIAALELIEDGYNGYIVPVENEHILAEKINYLLSDESLMCKMGERSLERIKPYTIENMAQVHCDVIATLMKKIINY